MSHFQELKDREGDAGGRHLGDEWSDWNGKHESYIDEGIRLFLLIAAGLMILTDLAACAFTYLITPRLAMFSPLLPTLAWGVTILWILLSGLWFGLLLLTVLRGRRILTSPLRMGSFFDYTFAGAFRLASALNISRDRVGHSFVKVSNTIVRATKPRLSEERLLILLPRCLTKEQLAEIHALKERYPLIIHTVSGGELARKKVKEAQPTAIIGVACERDLVSGIRDVGTKYHAIGIPNQRPEGPCKNTVIDMRELIDAIEHFLGPATRTA